MPLRIFVAMGGARKYKGKKTRRRDKPAAT
jgi:hypothetical protein